MLVRCFAAVAAFALAGSAVGSAAEAPPLRTLTFSVEYSVNSSVQERNSGLGASAATGDHLASKPPGFETHGFTVVDNGTLRIDVIAATADRGLVVDASFTGSKTKQPPIRVAIFENGNLTFDPKAPLCAQAAEVLPLLARGLFGEHAADPGLTWDAPVPPPATGTRNYRVTSAGEDTATLKISTDLSVKGPQGFEEHLDGTLTYATKLSTPLKWDALIRTRRASSAGSQLNDAHLTASLISDTFKKT